MKQIDISFTSILYDSENVLGVTPVVALIVYYNYNWCYLYSILYNMTEHLQMIPYSYL